MATEVKETTSLASSTSSIFGSGFTTGWLGLFILAGGIPIPPFSYLGYGGLNLWAAGSLQWGMAKAAFQGAMVFLHAILTSSYPQLKWIGYLLILNPWYIFDIVQMFSPAFAYEGFKRPLSHFDPLKPLMKPHADGRGGFTYSQGTLTAPLIVSAIALTCTGVYGFLNMIPASIARSYKPIVNTVFTVLGSLTALAGGGIGSAAAIPHIMSFLNSNTKEAAATIPVKHTRTRSHARRPPEPSTAPPLETLTASSPAAKSENDAAIAAITEKIVATEAITPTVIVPPTEPIEASAPYSTEYIPETPFIAEPGVQQGGAVLPALGDVIKSILEKNNAPKRMQSGGGRSLDDTSKYIFLGSLAFITVSGIGLALIRSKRFYINTLE
ncbi:hypothetical protein EBR66_05065 [bacterium]|nr:hypothetical protein [bacterium]